MNTAQKERSAAESAATDLATNKKQHAESDGKTHINIWIEAKTKLGRMLARQYHTPFTHPFFGPFNSMEGFWQYVQGETPDDSLRWMTGVEARNFGKNKPRRYVPNFQEIILAANFFKIEQNPKILDLFKKSTLPFDVYYLFGPGGVVIRPKGSEWIVESFEEIRRMMKEDRRPSDIDYTHVLK